ncbi:unnamed protein product, partial [Gadus morhua 'NCC']
YDRDGRCEHGPGGGKVTPKDSQYAAQLEARFPGLPPRGALFPVAAERSLRRLRSVH